MGKQLQILFKEPIIYVCTESRNILDTQVNVNTLTKISFEKNEVYINDKTFKINSTHLSAIFSKKRRAGQF